jgi:hypothetical protein
MMFARPVALASLFVAWAATPAVAQLQPTPGLWEITHSIAVGGAAPSAPRTVRQCVKESQTTATLSRPPGADTCTLDSETNQGGVYRSSWTCATGKVALELRFGRTDYAGAALVDATESGRTVRSRVAMSGRRIGDC